VKGTAAFPSSIFKRRVQKMIISTEIVKIEEFVNANIKQSENLFLVDITNAPGNKVTVLLDGDNGVTIDDCTAINKALYKFIEETALFGDANFSLEVSSPGVDRPLKQVRQYKKNIGRKVAVVINDGSELEGVLTQVNDENIIIEEKTGKGNKMSMKSTTILFNQIKHTTVLITF
jgi:ribosome maturation factor RimP